MKSWNKLVHNESGPFILQLVPSPTRSANNHIKENTPTENKVPIRSRFLLVELLLESFSGFLNISNIFLLFLSDIFLFLGIFLSVSLNIFVDVLTDLIDHHLDWLVLEQLFLNFGHHDL